MLTGISNNLLKLEYRAGFKQLSNESWSSEGGEIGSQSLPWILKISAKSCFLSFEWEKKKFNHFRPPSASPCKNPHSNNGIFKLVEALLQIHSCFFHTV